MDDGHVAVGWKRGEGVRGIRRGGWAVALVVCGALGGCASVAMARKELNERAKDVMAPADAANVYVYRPSSLAGTAVRLAVFLDEEAVGSLTSGTFALVTVRPGEHKLVARARGSAEKVLVVEAARTYYVKATPTMGWDGPGASVELVIDEKSARDDIRGCDLIASAAPERIRRIAAGIAKVNVDPVDEEALVAEATRALQALEDRRQPSGSTDLEATVARLRASRPGMYEAQIVLAGTEAMVGSLRPKREEEPPSESRVIDWSCGFLLAMRGHETIIAGLLPDSPAAVAQVELGAELREVSGQPARDHTPAEVARLLAGTPGSEVHLTLGRPDGTEHKVTLRRAPVDVAAVDCRILDRQVLYLRPWAILAATGRRVRDHGRARSAPPRFVILDLRDNKGGSIDAARDLADSFLASGTILSVAGRKKEQDKTYRAAQGTSALEEARLVVLVNGKTTGAAEAVAAAMQDNRRGRLLGSRTAGSGMTFTRYELGGIALSLPTGRILRPNGQVIDGNGVTADAADASPGPAPPAVAGDVACEGVASPSGVAKDTLVRRAVELLLAPAGDT